MLVKRLDPASDVHSARDINGLKQLVYAVEELVKSVPSDAGLDVHFNLQLAIKGIITAETTQSKAEARVDDGARPCI
jgi:hypothetical protein